MLLSLRHRVLRALPVVLALAAPAAAIGSPTNDPAPTPEATKSYIVVLEDSVNHPGRVAQRHAINRDADLDNVYKTALKGYAAAMTPVDKEAVERDPAVAYVERDVVMHTFSQQTPRGVQRISGTSNSTLDIDETDDVQVNADVAVIDTGVDWDHPDLRVVERTNCLNSKSNVCVNNQGDDGNGHGTHVAGTIGALDNSFGVVGVAPGVRLWAVKTGNSNGAFLMSDIIAGVDWVTARAGQIEVANMSLGCDPGSCEEVAQALHESIQESIDAGVVYVVAAGNYNLPVVNGTIRKADGVGKTEIYSVKPSIPAAFPEVITVSALADFDGVAGSEGTASCEYDHRIKVKYDPPITGTPYYYYDLDDSLAGFSNWGNSVDVTAPGTCIYSTYKHGRYEELSGTSMAAPHIAGAAAILASVSNPSTAGDVEDIRDTIRAQGSHEWDATHAELTVDNSDWEWIGDSEHEPLLDISNESVFKVSSPGDVGAIGVTSDNSGDLDVYARNGNNEIWRKAYRGNHWGNWFTVASPNNEGIVGAPAPISRRADSTDLFVKGPGGGIGFRNMYQGSWTSWFPIYPPESKAMLSSPAATNRPDIYDGLTMVIRGHDGNVYLKNYWESIPGGWSPWENLGAPAAGTASSPAITMHDETWLHLTVRGADGAIYGKAWGKAEQKWSSWVNLGTGFTSAPAMTTSRSGDEMYLFGVKTDGKLWMRKAVAGTLGWSEWESLGGNVVADPAATSRESHGVSVFVVGLDNKIQERRYTYGGWTNWMRIDDDCPPEACSWDPGGPGTGHIQSVEANDLVTVDAEGTANVLPGYGEGFDIEDPVTSLEGELDSALLDGKGHYVIDTADVNGDDNSDLITVKDDGDVLVHLGTEERTFEEATDAGITIPPMMNGSGQSEPIAVGDVNGDGLGDLVAFAGPGSGAIQVFKGMASGALNPTPTTSLSGAVNSALTDGTGSYFLDVTDVDGDDRADLVAMNNAGTVQVFKGQTLATFASATAAATIDTIFDNGSGHEPVGLGDVDADGRSDLVTLDGSGYLKLHKGQENGTFASATTAYGSTVDSSLLDDTGEELVGLLDYNNDGRADLLSVEDDGTMRTYAAKANATFDSPVTQEGELTTVRQDLEGGAELALEKPFVRRVHCHGGGCVWAVNADAPGDIDGDGHSDLTSVDGTATVFPGTATGIDAGGSVSSMEGQLDPALLDGKGHYVVDVAEIAHDGRADLITLKGEGEVLIHRGQPDHSFAETITTGITIPPMMNGSGQSEPIAVGDVNGDGLGDLVAFAGPGSGAIQVFKGMASGALNPTPTTSLSGAVNSALTDGTGSYFLDVTDVDGDDRADLVAMNNAGTVQVFKGQTLATFASATAAATIDTIFDNGSGHEPVGLGDVDADGRSDLVTLDGSGYLKLHKGQENGTFASATTAYGSTVDSSLLDDTGEELVGLLDYNNDGRADLLSVEDDGTMRTYAAKANATFDSPVTQEGELTTVRQDLEGGAELALEKPFVRRVHCHGGGCRFTAPPLMGVLPHEDDDPSHWHEVEIAKLLEPGESTECLPASEGSCEFAAADEDLKTELFINGQKVAGYQCDASYTGTVYGYEAAEGRLSLGENAFGSACKLTLQEEPVTQTVCVYTGGEPESFEFWARQELALLWQGQSPFRTTTFGRLHGENLNGPESIEATRIDYEDAPIWDYSNAELRMDASFEFDRLLTLDSYNAISGEIPCSWPELE